MLRRSSRRIHFREFTRSLRMCVGCVLSLRVYENLSASRDDRDPADGEGDGHAIAKRKMTAKQAM